MFDDNSYKNIKIGNNFINILDWPSDMFSHPHQRTIRPICSVPGRASPLSGHCELCHRPSYTGELSHVRWYVTESLDRRRFTLDRNLSEDLHPHEDSNLALQTHTAGSAFTRVYNRSPQVLPVNWLN